MKKNICDYLGEEMSIDSKYKSVVPHKTIAFFFPSLDLFPTGGFKICYEYANRFVKDGYVVYVVYPEYLGKPRRNDIIFRALRYIKHVAIFIERKMTGMEKKVPDWFELDSRVKREYVWSFRNSKTLKNTNSKIIATALATSFELAAIQQSPEQKKYYFVQDFESWGLQTSEDVYASYRLPLKKITITPWLRERIRRAGSDAIIAENGLDFTYFQMTHSIKDRNPCEIAMLYHNAEIKRSCDAIAALKIVKEKVTKLHVAMFGVPERPDVPEWFTYYQKPDKETHNKIYNGAAIFVAPSRLEGMGLTPAESMICGCAVACTDNPGFEIFAKDKETTLVSPVMDVGALAKNIFSLIQNNELRLNIAKAGHEYVKQFNWEEAYKKFKEALEL
jgi:glycosyltransferase involved in cell wall biosynthesis